MVSHNHGNEIKKKINGHSLVEHSEITVVKLHKVLL